MIDKVSHFHEILNATRALKGLKTPLHWESELKRVREHFEFFPLRVKTNDQIGFKGPE